MGGGTAQLQLLDEVDDGLSPRGRGNLLRHDHASLLSGSIPAWAGEPLESAGQRLASRVYPRVGGGTPLHQVVEGLELGLSPRGRGNPVRSAYSGTSPRSIPAWAGEPQVHPAGQLRRVVYPRVGGGTPIIYQEERTATGLSPRGRGNREGRVTQPGQNGSIPAWAGEP